VFNSEHLVVVDSRGVIDMLNMKLSLRRRDTKCVTGIRFIYVNYIFFRKYSFYQQDIIVQ